ncbi:MAG: class I SAM-dependent methyltransferase [Planctomycetes bacterium]|nr:class I SAM-dependent methyltransferase [Planctomycetota bacterium]
MISSIKNIIKRYLRYNPGLRFRVEYRSELPFILNAHGLVGEGVEIGVNRAVFSETILKFWTGGKLYCVDPWREYEGLQGADDSSHNEFYQEAMERLNNFPGRFEVMRMTSAEAAGKFDDASLDFAYIDALHSYEAVKEDISLWYPKIRSGGIISGHDYLDGRIYEEDFGVKTAVDEFVKEKGLALFISECKDWPSWFVVKP